MSKSKPKSAVPGVYYRDDGKPRWEVKVRWVNKEGVKDWLKTKRYPVDLDAKKGEPAHIERARKDAEAYAIVERQALETHNKPTSMRADGWTFRGLLQRYQEDMDKGLITQKSLNTSRASIRMILGEGKGKNKDGFPFIAGKLVKDLKYEDFVGEDEDSLQMQLKDRDGNKASNGALKRALTVYRGVFKRAQKTWKIELINPLEKIKGLPSDDARVRTVDEDEWASITHELTKHEQGTQDAIHFARWTAARRSEVVKLDWGDINWKKRIAKLRETKSKTDKVVERDIPVPAAAWEILLRRAQPANGKRLLTEEELAGVRLGGPIFTNDKGTRVRPDSLTQAWSRACARAGVIGARVHDLRHTRITELGRFLTAAEAARVSGHTDLTTFFRYFNPDAAETGRKIDQMEGGEKEKDKLQEVAKSLATLNDEDFGLAISMAAGIRSRGTAGR